MAHEDYDARNTHGISLDYADFISSFRWDDYATVTFRKSRYDAIYWSNKVAKTFERFGATREVVCVEPNRLDGIHIHSLIRFGLSDVQTASQTRARLWKYCFKAYGRTQIEAVNDVLAVSRYCAKYVVKGNVVHFGGLTDAWNRD